MERCFFHLISGLDIGGCEVVLANIVPDLKGGKHVVVVYSNRTSILEDELKSKGIEVHFLSARSLFDLKAVQRFKKLIDEYHPESLSTYLLAANFFGRFYGRLLGIKKNYCFIQSKHSPLRYWPYWIAERLTSFLVTRYFAVAPEVKNFYRKVMRFPDQRISVIRNGIDLKKFHKQSETIERVHRSLQLSRDCFLIGCVAKLRLKEKGQNYLVEAMEKVVQSLPNTKLILVGDGVDRATIEALVKEKNLEDHIELLGDRDDIAQLLSAMDLFVLPSLFEGMCIAIIEAMAASRAIIASDLPENRSLVTHNESAILVPPRDVEELANAIINLLKNSEKRYELGRAAHLASQTFSREVMLGKLNNLYVNAHY